MNQEFSSGGVVFKKKGKKVLWLLTHSSPSNLYPQSYWRLPKGWIDDENDKPGPFARGEKRCDEKTLHKAALREVKEEAGVNAKIIKKIKTIKFFYTKEKVKYIKFVTFYLMEWIKDLPSGFGFETSEIGWFDLDEAKEKLKHKSEKEILVKANKILSSDLQENLL